MRNKSLMIITGETSGDMHAAVIVAAMLKQYPKLEIFGVGGGALRSAGMEIVVDAREMAVLGLSEVVQKYFFFRRVFHFLLNLAKKRRPDAILLVDYPGFNLRFAAAARAAGFKVVYYVCPQVWAWHRQRIKKIARRVNRLLTIFPFEPELFGETDLAVDFVGHPLVSQAKTALQSELENLPWQSGVPRVALLPGSRRQEIQRLLPVMWETALLLEKKYPHISFIIAAPTTEMAELIREFLSKMGKDAGLAKRFSITIDKTRQVLRQADATLVASGTATVEAALMRCPMVIIYKVALGTYFAGRALIRVPYLGMVNILWQHLNPDMVKEPLCPEFIQWDAKPARLVQALEPLLTATEQRQKMLAGLDLVNASLGAGGGGEQAAEIILQEMEL